MMKPISKMTISEMLKAAGYGHRWGENRERDPHQVVYHLVTGEVIGRMSAKTAAESAEKALTHWQPTGCTSKRA